MNEQPNSPLEVFVATSQDDGLDLSAIPLSVTKVGEYHPARPREGYDEADEEPVSITADNVDLLGGRAVELTDVAAEATVDGRTTRAQVPLLRFTRGTAHWPAAIRDQVPEIARLVAIRQRVRDAMNDPKLKRRIAAWVKADPASRVLLDRILGDE